MPPSDSLEPAAGVPPTLLEATARLTAPGAPFEMEERVVHGHTLRCWKHVPQTLRELTLVMADHGDRTYLVYEDERLSYRECLVRVVALAHHLRDACDVQKGDRVAIAMRNYPEWPIAFWAASSLGAIVVPLNGWWQGEELAYGLSDSGTRVLIADPERAARIEPHRSGLALEHLLLARGEPEASGWRGLEAAIEAGAGHDALPPAEIEPEDDATIFYTSGTTGNPKGALGTHRNMCTNVGSAAFVAARTTLRKGLPLPTPGEPRPQLATLVSVPLFHVTGSHSMLAAGTHAGNKLVMMHRWHPARALELIERERITRFGGVPAMVWQVLESPDFERRDTSSVVTVGYGGAPAAPELVRRIKEVFPQSSPSNGYGLTETSAIATSNAGIDYEAKPHSVGPPVPICDVRVMSEEGVPARAGGEGELWIRGPNVVKGYWNKPAATAAAFSDGWLRTGDVVRLDDDGFVTILDRAKDMLIRGGENVYCVEVENVLYQHPEVMDAAVIGLPHRVLGEEVGAVVQVTAGSTLDAEGLRRHASERLAAFKVPVRVELRHEPLPRNANGKILKRQLRDELTGE